MAVRKLNGKWQADVTARGAGVRIRRTFETQKEAREAEARIKLEIANARLPRVGIESALTNYLKGEALALKDQNSVLSKARAIRPFIVGESFEDIGQVADEMKRAWLADGLKPATINRRLALLKRLGNLAYDWGWIDQPVSRRVKMLPGEISREFYLSLDQVEALADLCPRTGRFIRIAAFTGLRRSELLGLLEDSIQGDFIVLRSNTKTGKPRLVPIPEAIRGDIESLPLPIDSAMDYWLRKEWEGARIELNMPHIRFHDLRHTYASWLAQAGATLQLIGKAMGHSTPVMTNRYAHLLDEDLLRIADKLR